MTCFKAGFGKIDITPDLPVCTLYTRDKNQIADKITSRLYVRTAVFENDKVKIAIISGDLLALDSDFTTRVKKKIKRLGFKPENIMISCTHTHTAPNTINFNGPKFLKKEKGYLKKLETKIVECASSAQKDLKSAKIGIGKTKIDLNVNRREIGRMSEVNDLNSPTGLTDNETGIIFIEQNGIKKPSVIVNYAAHPLSMGKKSIKTISSDFPGEMSRIMEKDFKCVMFLQGCAGNINVKISGKLKVARKAGRIMADAVRNVYKNVSWEADCKLDMKTSEIDMPVDALEVSIKAHLEKKETENISTKEWLKKALKKARNTRSVKTIVQTIQISQAYLIALPGEQFIETALEIKKKSGKENCFVAAYANCGEIGYVPSPKAFKKGGYEVDEAYKYYGDHVYRNSPAAPSAFVKKALSLLKITNRKKGDWIR